MMFPPPAPAPIATRRVQPTLVTWLAITLIVVVPMVALLRPFLVSVAVGGILSVLVRPVFTWACRRLPRWAAGLIVTLGVVVLVLVPLSVLVIGAFRQGAVVLGQLSNEAAPTLPELIERARRWLPFTDALGTPEEIRTILKSGLVSLTQSVRDVLFAMARGVPQMALQLVVVILSIYFVLVDGKRLFDWIAGKLPLSVQIRTMLVESFRVTTNAVVLASVAAAGTQSLVLLGALLLLGVPAALFGAGAAFVLAWIPPVGSSPVWIAATIYLYAQGSPLKAGIMVGVGLFVGVIDNVVRPLVLRGRQEMHPMVSLLAILGGLSMFGLPGVFIGPLLASMFIAVFDIWPAVASYCGIPVSDAGEEVPDVPMLDAHARD